MSLHLYGFFNSISLGPIDVDQELFDSADLADLENELDELEIEQ